MVSQETMRERFRSQLLSGERARTPLAVAEQLLAIQAQDLRGFRLAVRARSTAERVSVLDAALAARELVVGWLNRGTLHLVPSADYRWLHSLVSPQLERPLARRREQLGISPSVAERALTEITKTLANGPTTRSQLVAVFEKRGLPSVGQAPVHLFGLAAQRGLILRGPMQGREQAYVMTDDWLGPRDPGVDREVALAELARRYLVGHGPADVRDLSQWSGLSLTECRKGFASIASELVERSDGLFSLHGQDEKNACMPPSLLLGAFEPLLLGWSSRDEIVGENWERVARGGMISAFALVEGRAAANWRVEGRRVEITPFSPLGDETQQVLDTEADAVLRYLDL
ncbi:MAG TPA: winged helix DNA-binding domain-containing protein [Gaiellaceae bacterium]|nr:winged helix DNA-binding domain-containing protein [Gaiellaceae bacterium]